MCNGTVRNRGRLLAAYMIMYYIGTVVGQLLVSKVCASSAGAAVGNRGGGGRYAAAGILPRDG